MALSTTANKLYFIELDDFERLEIQFVPDSIRESRNSGLKGVQVIGQNQPVYFQTGGEDKIDMKLDFYSDVENRKDVMQKCNWLKSLTYSRGFESDATRVQLVFGELYRNKIWLVQSVRTDFSMFNKEFGFLPQQAYVDITLVNVENLKTQNDVR